MKISKAHATRTGSIVGAGISCGKLLVSFMTLHPEICLNLTEVCSGLSVPSMLELGTPLASFPLSIIQMVCSFGHATVYGRVDNLLTRRLSSSSQVHSFVRDIFAPIIRIY